MNTLSVRAVSTGFFSLSKWGHPYTKMRTVQVFPHSNKRQPVWLAGKTRPSVTEPSRVSSSQVKQHSVAKLNPHRNHVGIGSERTVPTERSISFTPGDVEPTVSEGFPLLHWRIHPICSGKLFHVPRLRPEGPGVLQFETATRWCLRSHVPQVW